MRSDATGSAIVIVAGALAVVFVMIRAWLGSRAGRSAHRTSGRSAGTRTGSSHDTSASQTPSSTPGDFDPAVRMLLGDARAEFDVPLADLVALIRTRDVERIGQLELRSLSTSLYLAIDRVAVSASGTPGVDEAIASATRLYDELVREERRRERRSAAG